LLRLSIESRYNFGLVLVLSVFLLSLLSLAFVLGSDIKKNAKRVLQSGFHVF
jgi:hypothetical protein